jgi:hypothetical protein
MLDNQISLIVACTVGRTQSSKKAWSEEEEEELRRLYQEFTNKAEMEGGNSGGGNYIHTHRVSEKSLCNSARTVLHCAGSAEVPYIKHFRWHM